MMNKYIKIVMEPTKRGIGGAFNAKATFKLDNINPIFNNITVKIDTGCSISVIPLAKYKINKILLTKLKSQDIQNNVSNVPSYGVETGSNKPPEPQTYQEKMDSPALKFEHNISNFTINGVTINNNTIYVNYDRTGNILIGMDILKDWDIHIGTVDKPDLPEVGQTMFLGCPRDQMNDEYLLELERLFGTGSSISTALLRSNPQMKTF